MFQTVPLRKNASERLLKYMTASHNAGELTNPSGTATMTGQCGDSIGVHVAMEGQVLKQIRVQPDGCLYTRLCAEAMSVLAQGRPTDDILKLEPQDIADELGGLPEDHIHCARLALNALGEAIADAYASLSKGNKSGEN